jgi:hypothetical protein
LFTDEYSEIEMIAKRADWAHTALVAFAKQTGQSPEAENLEDADCFYEVAGDLIANMGHLADVYGHDAEHAVFRGRGHYEEECAEAVEELHTEVFDAMDELRTVLETLAGALTAAELGQLSGNPALACVAQTAADLDEAAEHLKGTADWLAEVDPSLKELTTGAGALADAVAVIRAATSPTREGVAG